jgi:hypothetical protein
MFLSLFVFRLYCNGSQLGDASTYNAFEQGCAAYSCNAVGLASCTLTELCGDQDKPWFVYVRSNINMEGNFSFNLIVRRMFTLRLLFIASSHPQHNRLLRRSL